MPNIQIVRENSLGLNRGIYADWMGNALSDANANALLAEGSAVTVLYQQPFVSGVLTGPQAARTDITGVVASTESGKSVGPDGVDYWPAKVQQDLNRNVTAILNEDGSVALMPEAIYLNCVADGVTDVTHELQTAAEEANLLGVPVVLPKGTIVISETIIINKMVGVKGKSKIILAGEFTKTGFANQFCILNSSFSQSYNDTTANTILHKDYEIETTPTAPRSIIGLANVKSGLIDNVKITANQFISGGKPVNVDALIDLYACVKNVEIKDCTLSQLTGAYGSTRVSAGGGGCIWVRNLKSNSGDALLNITEHNSIHHNTFYHTTSDECLAVYGVRGVTRYNQIHHNRFYGIDYIGAYHAVLVSIFPLDDGSGAGLGGTAAVYGNSLYDNFISDRSFLYNVIKIGNSGDASRLCYNNKSSRNIVTAYRSSDGTTGPKAIWTAAGSPSTDPDVASKVILCVNGTLGLAYSGAISGNSSVCDSVTVEGGGAQTNAGYQGWHTLESPTCRGNVYTGAEQCRVISGGEFDVFGRAYYNCNQVIGGYANINGTGSSAYCVNYIDSSFAQSYLMTGVRFTSASGFVNITSTVPAASRVMVNSNTGNMNNAAIAAIINNANASTVVKAHINSVSGAMSAPASGTGTTTKTDNNWSGTTD